MFQSRPAVHEDFMSIAAMPQNEEELFYMYPKGMYPITAEELEQVASNRYSPTVVIYKGEVAAYCNLYDVEEGAECWLGNLIVHPKFRKHGTGSYLIETMKNVARSAYRAQALKLICHNTNTPALLLYLKNGFRSYDMMVKQDKMGRSIVGILMSTKLDAPY
jgi:ribosomal protein S18 acetylase RimI-like enzyme